MQTEISTVNAKYIVTIIIIITNNYYNKKVWRLIVQST